MRKRSHKLIYHETKGWHWDFCSVFEKQRTFEEVWAEVKRGILRCTTPGYCNCNFKRIK